MNFAVQANLRVKLKESIKYNEHLSLLPHQKKNPKTQEGESNVNLSGSFKNSYEVPGKEFGKPVN